MLIKEKVELVLFSIFIHALENLQDDIQKLSEQNGSNGSYKYLGKIYGVQTYDAKDLKEHLWPKGEEIRLRQTTIKEDRERLSKYFNNYFTRYYKKYGYLELECLRNLLPETLAKNMPSLSIVNRTREEGFFFILDIQRKEYNRVCEIINSYLMVKFTQ